MVKTFTVSAGENNSTEEIDTLLQTSIPFHLEHVTSPNIPSYLEHLTLPRASFLNQNNYST